jgi:hypothetical protein
MKPLSKFDIFYCSFSSYRVRIEHCNGVLKEKFSSLKELKLKIKTAKDNEKAVDWIVVCIILYNITLPLRNGTSPKNRVDTHDDMSGQVVEDEN